MREKLPVARMLIDSVVIALLVTGAGLAFGPAYGGTRFLIALGIGAIVGAVSALVPVLLRWPAWTSVPLVLVGYLVFGGVAAAPRTTAAGVFPTFETVRMLSVGVITSWKQMLTVAVPVGSGGTLLLPAFLSALVLAAAGATVALRTRIPLAALIAPGLMGCGAAVLGSSQAFHPAISGTALALVAVVWAGWRRRAVGLPGLDHRRPIALVALLVPAVAGGLLIGPQLIADTEPRAIARDVVQPDFDPTTLASPLSGYRNFVKREKDTVLFTVHNLPANTPVRLATLDSYDGRIYSTSSDTGVFKRVGDRISGAPDGVLVDLDVTVGEYHDYWAPGAGYLAGISFDGAGAERLRTEFRYNPQTGSALVTGQLQPGDQYSMTASIPQVPTERELAAAQLADQALMDIAAENVPVEVAAKAQEWSVGAEGPGAVATAIAAELRQRGWVSHGSDSGPTAMASAGGHSAGRIKHLLTSETMTGDAEQYAVAMALMLWTKKIPSRVVMGFRPQNTAGTAVLTGEAMTAWVEVPFADYGWVRFEPTPDQAKEPPKAVPTDNPAVIDPDQKQAPPQQTAAKDATVQSTDPSSNPSTKQSKENKQAKADPPAPVDSDNWWWLVVVGLGVLLLLVPLLLILMLKLRRRRRFASGSPDQRIAGAWSHLLDTATDFGRTPPVGATRVEIGKELDRAFATRHVATVPGGPPPGAGNSANVPDARASVVVLANRADATVFSPDPVAPDDADRYWAEMDRAIAGLRGSQSGWRRLRARLSLASLRRKDHR